MMEEMDAELDAEDAELDAELKIGMVYKRNAHDQESTLIRSDEN
jgi:hypothetical protein